MSDPIFGLTYTATTSETADAARSNPVPAPPPVAVEKNLSATAWGMISFLGSEAAFFATLIVAYLTFLGKDKVGPTPAEALSLPLVLLTTIVLVSSSVTIHFAERKLRTGDQRGFQWLWGATIALGAAFLAGTAYEWHELMTRHHLTISRNLFGTTYYTLVGFHGLHVTAGVIVMLIMLGLALGRQVTVRNRTGIEMVSWYWHFVDGVWLVVFTVVYLVGR
jgi:cytochrome c oxidase subunit 3/cytochrome o ubiquinol oxidase subunit 3